MSMEEIRRQEEIRDYAAALLRMPGYDFTGEDARRAQLELQKRLDAGEPVDEKLLGPLAKRADESRLRVGLSEHYSEDEVERLMELHRSFRGDH